MTLSKVPSCLLISFCKPVDVFFTFCYSYAIFVAKKCCCFLCTSMKRKHVFVRGITVTLYGQIRFLVQCSVDIMQLETSFYL